MVKGFDKFKQYFAPHSGSFIVIGDPTDVTARDGDRVRFAALEYVFHEKRGCAQI